VVALELDAGLADHLAHRFSGHEVTVVHADACGWTWPAERFSVVANLPFTGSSAILASLLRNPNHRLERAHVIVQWELAARHAAVWPATLKGTYWRTWNELEITDRLSRSAFAPAPDVDAAVLRIAPRPEALVPPPQHDAYWRFLARAFKAGKPIAAALRADFRGPELRGLADTLGFSPDAQPRDLDVRQWTGLFARARGRRR
jgi:23S rRNA (adenine-N6)-dimethyltransferase